MIRLLLTVLLLSAATAAGAADIVIVNKDGPNEGLNDPAPPNLPAPGNPGDSLGEQRRFALQYAAQILESRLVIRTGIRIAVDFEALACSDNNALIGSGGAKYLISNFPNAPRPDTLYPTALGNTLARQRLDLGLPAQQLPYPDIVVTFTSAIDSPAYSDCLGGGDWYYGFDGQTPPGDLNFLNTAVHEIMHGFGFQSFVNVRTGQFFQGPRGNRLPDVYSTHIKALSFPGNPLWPEMTAEQRSDSADDTGSLVWAPGGNSNTPNAVSELIDGVRRGSIQLYAPNPIEVGSSVSHFATSVLPNQIMEPFNNNSIVLDGLGLSLCILQDIGWNLAGAYCPDNRSVPPPDFRVASDGGNRGSGGQGGTSDDSASSDGDGGSGSSGGGCTVKPGAPFNPLFPGLLFVALAVLAWRRRGAGSG